MKIQRVHVRWEEQRRAVRPGSIAFREIVAEARHEIEPRQQVHFDVVWLLRVQDMQNAVREQIPYRSQCMRPMNARAPDHQKIGTVWIKLATHVVGPRLAVASHDTPLVKSREREGEWSPCPRYLKQRHIEAFREYLEHGRQSVDPERSPVRKIVRKNKNFHDGSMLAVAQQARAECVDRDETKRPNSAAGVSSPNAASLRSKGATALLLTSTDDQ